MRANKYSKYFVFDYSGLWEHFASIGYSRHTIMSFIDIQWKRDLKTRFGSHWIGIVTNDEMPIYSAKKIHKIVSIRGVK